MKNKTVINRYARAFLNLGLADGQFIRYGQELENLAGALTALSEEEAKAFYLPIYPAKVRRGMLEKILALADLSPLTANFLHLLLDKDRLRDLPEIAATYNRLVDAENGLVRARVTSAFPLGQSEIVAVKAALSKFSGRQVELTVDRDPELIGGMVAKLGDLTIDGSVRTQLLKLAEGLDGLN